MALVCSILASTTRGYTHINPIGGPITMPCIKSAIHQGFGQPGSNAVQRVPVVGDGTQGQPQHMTGQILDGYPGQDQETAVIDQPG